MGDIKSYSGDAGDRIIGGKPEYIVLWDVFKDVEEVSSAEFTVRAELVEGVPTRIQPINLTGWDKKKFQVLFIYQNNGPKFGCMIGYFNTWGIVAEFASGKMVAKRAGFTVLDNLLPVKAYYNLDLVKRFFNQNDIQSYLLVGVSENPLLFGKSTDINDFEVRYLAGAHLGISLALNRIVLYLGCSMMPSIGATEKEHDLLIVSSDTYFDMGFGFRF